MAADDHADPDHAGGLHHVELYGADYEAAAAFWDWLLGALGYAPKDSWDGGRSWRHGPTYLVLVETDRREPAFDRRAPGLNHLAFHAGTRDQVDAITEGVRERDDARVALRGPPPLRRGVLRAVLRGPDRPQGRGGRPGRVGLRR